MKAVKDFEKAGGTHFVLCQLPMINRVIRDKNYKSCYKLTLDMADTIRSTSKIGVFVTVGPYPVDYIKLRERFGRNKAVDIMKKGIDEAAKLCEENEIIAIGEIGRPHFPVDEQTMNDSNIILNYGMKRARDVNVPVVLHTESTTPEHCKNLVEMGKRAGIPINKIVKHYSPPLILESENHGLMPSVLSSEKNILTALKKGTRFMMETDYLDDPNRPGAVLGPKTVPKRTNELIKNEILSEEQAFTIHVENPSKTYGLDLYL